jgi:streptomycin 3"-adenylyltransferase
VEGGLRPASDIDLLFVTTQPLAAATRQLLAESLMSISAQNGARPLDATFVAQGEVRPWRFPPTVELQYGEWLRDEIKRDGAPQARPMPDLAIAVMSTLANGRRLLGPAAEDLLDPVPAEDLNLASLNGVPALLADLEWDTRNVLLTLARIWLTVSMREVRSKDAAASWAVGRLNEPQRLALAYARDLYLNTTYADEQWPDEIRAVVSDCAAAILYAIDSGHPAR